MTKDVSNSPRGRRRSPEEKLQLVLEASALSEGDLGAFLRREGIRKATLDEWKETVSAAATAALRNANSKRAKVSPEEHRIQQLEKELQRKEKALAETAALLVLKKKLEEIWGDEDSGTTPRSES